MTSDLFLAAPDDLVWLEPWESVKDSGDVFDCELRREIAEEHVLNGVPVVAVARRTDCDDVLFATADRLNPLAVVHLTWGNVVIDSRSPYTTFYEGWRDWIDRCLIPDHNDCSEPG
jgi:hypothetical protein